MKRAWYRGLEVGGGAEAGSVEVELSEGTTVRWVPESACSRGRR